MKTKKEIIIETILHYTVEGNSRSIGAINTNGGQECLYHGDNGEQCAFSRVCKKGTDLSSYEGSSASMILNEAGYDILQDEYRIKSIGFWDSIQRIHDDYIIDSYNFYQFLDTVNNEFKSDITEEDLPGVEEWFDQREN